MGNGTLYTCFEIPWSAQLLAEHHVLTIATLMPPHQLASPDITWLLMITDITCLTWLLTNPDITCLTRLLSILRAQTSRVSHGLPIMPMASRHPGTSNLPKISRCKVAVFRGSAALGRQSRQKLADSRQIRGYHLPRGQHPLT